jgi:MFS family permease
MRTYRRVVAHGPLGPLMLATAITRLPQTMNSLALVLFVQQATGSFTAAGAATGGFALGTAAGGPVISRFADRRGPWIMLPLSVCHAAFIVTIVVLPDASPAWFAVLATMAGLAYPPTQSVLRARLRGLLADSPELIGPAFALDTITVDFTFVSGPLLAGLLAEAFAPSAALVCSATGALIGPTLFLRYLPPAAPVPYVGGSWWGPLRSPAVSTIVLAMMPFGLAIGALEVMIPAFCRQHGAPTTAGVLLAVWAAGSVLGGVIYGAVRWRRSVEVRHLWFSLCYPVAFIPLLGSDSIVAMAALVVPAGALIGPTLATRYQLVTAHAPRGTETEASTWPLTMLLAGLALGSGISGALVQGIGWRAAVIASIAAASVAAVLVLVRSHTLAAPPEYRGATA